LAFRSNKDAGEGTIFMSAASRWVCCGTARLCSILCFLKGEGSQSLLAKHWLAHLVPTSAAAKYLRRARSR
jgi:hypothetical protein